MLNYIDRLDGLAHLLVTGTCEDPATGTIYVVARTLADPPVFYLRSFVNGAWTGWAKIPLDIKAHQVVPALYRGRVCLFWLDVKVSNEPQQNCRRRSSRRTRRVRTVAKYVSLGLSTSPSSATAAGRRRRRRRASSSTSRSSTSSTVSDAKAVEALYTLKVQTAATAGYGANLWVDVFRLGDYPAPTLQAGLAYVSSSAITATIRSGNPSPDSRTPLIPVNLPRGLDAAVLTASARGGARRPRRLRRPLQRSGAEQRRDRARPWRRRLALGHLLSHAQSTYGPDAQPLLPLPDRDPDLTGELGTASRRPARWRPCLPTQAKAPIRRCRSTSPRPAPSNRMSARS